MPTPLFSLDRPLSKRDLNTYSDELQLLQGNILKSHGRDEMVSVFLTFHDGQVGPARAFVRGMADRVTSAAKQSEQARGPKATGNELFTSFCLSAAGYRFFGCDVSRFELTFIEGLRGARERLDDPPVDRWEPKFREQLHAMVTFAHKDPRVIQNELGTLQNTVGGIASVSSETGHAMRKGRNTVEHFGFFDGVSQPRFFETDLASADERRQWDPQAGPNLVLVKDPLAASNKECGSYFVFRKLEQNVKGFKLRQRALAAALGVAEDLAGAFVVGRFKDGTPVAIRDRMNGKQENDFTYRNDPNGNSCPFFAHVRKTNPRGETGGATPDAERAHRIVRRGFPYGPRNPAGDDESTWPEHGSGLLFQCYQASLSNQFEVLQLQWANQPNFVRAGVGQDTVIGQRGATRVSVPAQHGSTNRVPFDFGQFVHMLGGEYFFAPSIATLRRL